MTSAKLPLYEAPEPSRPQTYPDLLRAIGDLTGGAAETDDFEVESWAFRGLPDATWDSTSTLWRGWGEKNKRRTPLGTVDASPPNETQLIQFESRIVHPARKWMLSEGLPGGLETPNLLAHLQHHGMWTRLLDLTSNPLTALFFASADDNVDGRLLAVDVNQLTQYRTDEPVVLEKGDRESVPPTVDEKHVGWRVMLNRSAAVEEPFVVWPAIRDARMRAQEGFFMASAVPTDEQAGLEGFPLVGIYPPKPTFTDEDRGRPIEHIFDDWTYRVKSIVVPAAMKRQLRSVLKLTFARSDREVYPDISGFVAYAKEHIIKVGSGSEPRPGPTAPPTT